MRRRRTIFLKMQRLEGVSRTLSIGQEPAPEAHEPEDEEIPDYDITAEDVAGQSHGGALPSSRDSHFLKD